MLTKGLIAQPAVSSDLLVDDDAAPAERLGWGAVKVIRRTGLIVVHNICGCSDLVPDFIRNLS